VRYFGPTCASLIFLRKGRNRAQRGTAPLSSSLPSLCPLSAAPLPSPSLSSLYCRHHGGACFRLVSLPLRHRATPLGPRRRFRLGRHLMLRGRNSVLRERYRWLHLPLFLMCTTFRKWTRAIGNELASSRLGTGGNAFESKKETNLLVATVRVSENVGVHGTISSCFFSPPIPPNSVSVSLRSLKH
jgi:hypothetical protein